MPLLPELQTDVHASLAAELIAHGNDTFDAIVARYKDGYQRLWGREGFTVADAQAVIDAMGASAIPAFLANFALGQFINTVAPGTLAPEELSAPVPYTLDGSRIVLDPNATYPTETPVEETPAPQPE